MFLNFKITNYRSIGKEIVVNFEISESQRKNAYSEVGGKAINNIACIVGPNASGKSNILKAIVFFLRYICRSYSVPSLRGEGNVDTHFCCENAPTEFSTEFIDNQKQYKYEIGLFKGEVQKEWLGELKENTKRYNTIFKRESGKRIQNTLSVNTQDLERLRDDMSLLSLLLELNYFGKGELGTVKKLLTNVRPEVVIGQHNPLRRLSEISKELEKDKLLFEELMEELKNIDTGISELGFGKLQKINSDVNGEEEYSAIVTKHTIDGEVHPLLLLQESSGTLSYIDLFVHLYKIFRDGGLLIADELEQSLHPDITSRIINRFLDPEKNPNNSQILFTTHNPWFLQNLTKTQIFIAEKNSKSETELTRLDDIQGVRNDENYFIKYLAGEYDGRPKIKEA
ncbi:MAG TPA: AAA family ATPase [Candidatus Enterousia intestinigallinarum]|uniref:AAA family ATPase n=1 Tax=Candidatus Enterousia intestinigallinarum TaxID=2840790 RepID=A0A9D1JWQ6_9PROT|nr:AAA family ATPase [Candidatus Enterousia intestinigallinarum]